MDCPKCGARTYVNQTFNKKYKVTRIRKCSNKKCNKSFKTVEMESTGWEYKAIVNKIKLLIKDVK